MSKGNLFVFSGASGVGKSTVLSKVMSARSDLCFSVSATTRAPRQGEEHGVHYYFVTVDEFQDMIAGNQMLEYDFHNDTFYGTPKQQLDEKLREKNVVLDVEPVGAFNIKQVYPDATLIFVMPPSVEELERRLRSRGDTSAQQIELRLERAKWEMEQRFRYDYIVVNQDADVCAQEILKIMDEHAHEE